MPTENKMHSRPEVHASTKQSSNDPELKEFLISQNKFLQELVDTNSQKLARLQKIQELLYRDSETSPERKIFNPLAYTMNLVFDSPYTGRLKCTKEFPTTICKSKYFRISVEAESDSGCSLSENERVDLSVSLYTVGPNSQKIVHTMKGRSIFRGDTDRILAFDPVESRHLAHFKLQICEVSSHFVGGMVTLIIEQNIERSHCGINLRPLVLENLQVRAKHTKVFS